MAVTEQQAVDAIESIYNLMDRQEWDSDTTADIADILGSVGLECRPPRNLREWTAGGQVYLAEHIGDGTTRIAVWIDKENENLTGVQFIRENQSIHDDIRSGHFMLRGHHSLNLEQRLDKAIEKYERIRA